MYYCAIVKKLWMLNKLKKNPNAVFLGNAVGCVLSLQRQSI